MLKIICIFSVFLLLSCTLGPDYERPDFYKEQEIKNSLHLSSATPIPVAKDWYTMFKDDTLNKLVVTTLKNNPQVGAAIAKLRQARASFKINSVSMYPSLNADGSYNYVKDSINYGVPISTDYYQSGLDAAWELDIWGGGRRVSESALALVNAASADLENVRLSMVAEVASTYIQLRQTQENLKISQENLKVQQELYNLTKDKYASGLTDDITLNQSQYLLSQTQSQIPILEAQESAYKNSLSILTGQLPGSLEQQLQSTKSNLVSRPFDYPLENLYKLPVSVIRNRPDVEVAEQNLIAQNAKIGQAVSQLFPSINLSGFLGYQSSKLHNLVSSNNDMYSYNAAISLPLFHWGALVNNVNLQKAAKEEELKLYQGAILTAANEIRNAMVQIEKDYQSNQHDAQSLSSQQEINTLTVKKYEEGLIEFSEVLTAQQNLLTAQNSYTNSNANTYLDLIRFYKAIGGGYKSQMLQMCPLINI